jgi:hypothetical protein
VTDIQTRWAELAARAGAPPGWLTTRVYPTAACCLMAAVEKPGNTPAFLVEVDAAAIDPRAEFRNSRGLEISLVPVSPGPSGAVRICFRLAGATYQGVFAVLVEDIASAVAACADQRAAVRTLVARLTIWQAFLQKHGHEGLGQEEQLGLFGELWFLRAHLLPRLDPSTAVAGWVGPLGRNQDFCYGATAFEVKTTAANAPQRIRIANLRQLDDTGIPAFVLVHLSLDARDGAGESLPEVVRSVRALLEVTDPAARILFDDRMITRGYLNTHEPHYRRTGYTNRNHRYYRVSQGFPRILERDTPDGVEDVSYSILLAACLAYRIPEGDALRLLGV